MNGQHNGTNAQHPHRENWNAHACAGMFLNTQSNSSPGTTCVAMNAASSAVAPPRNSHGKGCGASVMSRGVRVNARFV
eukprot:CAMPEP_0179619780 /NCGR_PEP_ID=MMETSP0932-20121108/333_1 /TAXON_ID=548131 ORGANISM="Ostreococcus mediterraneus, Strain clade-D-RCC2596" /NCGR_SAMPLE_ID=MMETSP0932 /ASSEMBLY_ACC=CAM_ASM_000582 /LENGTH=77 /DNA_ID=CAMNT_0021488769 /DNA_START=398 /DNA_END=628 /DNA_ORIENTATION=+